LVLLVSGFFSPKGGDQTSFALANSSFFIPVDITLFATTD
jgi:hypothetical protein